jgi:GNAT superfamily N-acetyltransferase
MDFKLRKGKKEDLKAVFELIKELAIYEKAEHELLTNVEVLENNCFGENAFVAFFVAENEKAEILGAAIYYYKYSTWKGKCIFLEDLIVKEEHRKLGIGFLLLEAVIKRAKKEKLKRIEWQVLKWNTPAIKFYDKFESLYDDEWLNCQMNETLIKNYLPKKLHYEVE